MSWHVTDGLWSLTCDHCGDGWYEWDGDLLFEFRRDLDAFAQMNGWVLGDTGAICPTCGLALQCKAAGHRWGPWIQLEPSPLVADGSVSEVRVCETCTEAEYRPR